MGNSLTINSRKELLKGYEDQIIHYFTFEAEAWTIIRSGRSGYHIMIHEQAQPDGYYVDCKYIDLIESARQQAILNEQFFIEKYYG